MTLPIGIDLGTSTSEIAVFRNGRPELIHDVRNSRNGILPSVVALGPGGELIVGESAKRYPDRVELAKRSMGSDDRLILGGREYRAQEISARILRHLKENAERVLGEPVTNAVITVPHAFKDPARKSTRDAGELAGLVVDRIINEPTAAALAYGLESLDSNQHVLVFDFGGGTLDVSILEMFNGVFEVKASAGDPRLGGADLDEVLAVLIREEIRRVHGESFLSASEGDRVLQHAIRDEAEKAKIELSSQDATVIDIPYLGGRSLGLHMVINRREFEIAARPLVRRAGDLMDRALADARLAKNAVDEVILVGGSTRVPAVREFVSRYFDGRSLPERVPPDEAVALGAAVQSALKRGDIDSSSGMIVTDVTQHSLGVAVAEMAAGMLLKDRMSVIVPRQTTIPTERTHRYATLSDGQAQVRIRVFEGESPDVSKNQLLDEFTLSGIPPAPAGDESIDIKFTIDVNGHTDVSASIVSTGLSSSVRISDNRARMTEAEKQLSATALQEQWKRSAFYKRVAPLLATAERQLPNLSGETRSRVDAIVAQLKEALASNDERNVEELDRALTDVLFELQ